MVVVVTLAVVVVVEVLVVVVLDVPLELPFDPPLPQDVMIQSETARSNLTIVFSFT